jgi:hypothetical protein
LIPVILLVPVYVGHGFDTLGVGSICACHSYSRSAAKCCRPGSAADSDSGSGSCGPGNSRNTCADSGAASRDRDSRTAADRIVRRPMARS